MIYLRTIEAARLLDITPNTLREWERRFGFPVSRPSANGAREFVFDEIVALRTALQGGLSIASSMSEARATLAAENADSLFAGFRALDSDRCLRLLESSLMYRSLEGAVEDVIVPALDLLCGTHGDESVQWAFAADFTTTWIRETIRQTWRPTGAGTVLLANASRDDYDGDAVYIQSLELLCRLSGFAVVHLKIGHTVQLSGVAAVSYPNVLVIAGSHKPDDIVDRWAWSVRGTAAPAAVTVFRRDPRGMTLVAPIARQLAPSPSAARQELLALVDHHSSPQSSHNEQSGGG